MPATEAQILANRQNAQRSTGPKTPEGKEVSRANAVKHGLTAVKCLPERMAAEVRRRTEVFIGELKPSGEVGMILAQVAARLSVRMDGCAESETASQTERVRKVLAEFEAPDGATEADIRTLRTELEARALLDSSREEIVVRRYGAAAERGFFRALKELRVHEKAIRAADLEEFGEESGSFPGREMTDDEFDALYPDPAASTPRAAPSPAKPVDFPSVNGRFDVPITIGKPR